MIKIANVDFYYAIGSRYSYLASTQIDALKTATGCHVEWHPINSVRLISQREHNPFTGKPSGQYEWAYRELDAQRWAKFYRVPYLEPRGRVQFDSELLARACTVAKQFDKVVEYSHLLFTAMFQNSITQIDERECIDRAEICGISTKDFQTALRSQETTNQLDEAIDNATNAGVFGVPTFIVNGELFWGNDRLILLRNYLDSDRFEAWESRLVSNPNILGGEIVFPNSRLSVQRIGGSLERGESLEILQEDYPYLTDEDFNFARIYVKAYPT